MKPSKGKVINLDKGWEKILSILGWIFGIIFILVGLFSISSFFTGFFFILSGLIIFPPINNFLRDKFKFNLGVGLRVFLFLVFIITAIFTIAGSPFSKNYINTYSTNDYIEVSIDELYNAFGDYSELSEIQKKELYKNKYEGKTIKTSIRADKIDEASLSSQYIVLQMSGLITCEAKAFFPANEKDKLLKANLKDIIIFTGKLINYDFGFASCLEFSDSKVLEIKK